MNEDTLAGYEAAKSRLFDLNSELLRIDRRWREGLEEESSFVDRLGRVLAEAYEVIATMREIVRQTQERDVPPPVLWRVEPLSATQFSLWGTCRS